MYLIFNPAPSASLNLTTTPMPYVRPDRPCPRGQHIGYCQNSGQCIYKFESGEWLGPECRCTDAMFHGKRCELFRPPGMLTETQTLLLAGGIFIGLVIITLVICIVVGVRWYQNRASENHDHNVEQPLMNGTPNGPDSISNNNNNEDILSLKVQAQTAMTMTKDSPVYEV